MSDFSPALPKVVKWSVGDNRYDDNGKNPKNLSLFIPLESVEAFTRYLNSISTDPEKIKKGKVWDYSQKAEVEVDGIYVNGKGRDGQYGAFGSINPSSHAPLAAEDLF
jgi:hypothetical protein